MTFGPILAFVALLALVAVLPLWPWSRRFGNRPAIVLTVVLAAVVILIALQIL